MPEDNVQPDVILLRKEWDYSPHIDTESDNGNTSQQDANNNHKQSSHCHVTRKIERDYLMDFFRRRREGALLVSGRRGVGKTSTIVAAILASQEILKKEIASKKKNDDIKLLLPILINAPNFEIRKLEKSKNNGEAKDGEPKYDVDLSDFKRLVLQNLVRGLYNAAVRYGIVEKIDIGELAARNKDGKSKTINSFMKNVGNTSNPNTHNSDVKLKNKISSLFRRAVAREVRTESNLKETDLERYLLEKQATYEMNLSDLVKTTAISVSSALIAAFSLPIIKAPELLTQIAPIIIGITPQSIVMSWQVKKTMTNQREAEKNASIYYLYDYDISTLQSELEETIRVLTQNNWKVIFVIDELDKIEDETNVIEVIKSLKSLLNQASALFVLICGEEFFKLVQEESENRGKGYTLFSQRIFLRRPQFAEITKFMDKIVDPSSRGAITKLFTWGKYSNNQLNLKIF
jgi:hypothetical protein